MITDLRLALRSLAKSRGLTLVAVCTLAVGIGSTTAIFSTLQALVLSPFSYPASNQLVQVWSGDGRSGNGWSLSIPDFIDQRAQCTSFSAFGLYEPTDVNIGSDKAQSVRGIAGTHEVLRAFGVSPMLGRYFEDADDALNAPPVVILGYSLWQQRFAGDPQAVGQKLRIDGKDYLVVGVMPEKFEFVSPWLRTESPQLWVPRSFSKDELIHRDNHYMLGIARLKPGISVAVADAEVKTIGRRLTKLYPDSNTGKGFLVRSLRTEMTHGIAGQVWLLFIAVLLVLLVACGNVASMLLARNARRQGEYGVRVALGASSGDLVRLALAESLVLALGGAVLGVALAYFGIDLLRVLAPVTATRKAAISLNVTALAFGLGATVLTALVAGIPPAIAAMRATIASVIRTDARGTVGSAARHRLLRNLIVAQVTVAFILANAAVLFSEGYLKLVAENSLLSTDAVSTGQVALNGPRYLDGAQRVQFWTQFVEHMQAIPGVTTAAITSKLPLEGGASTNGLVNDEVYDPAQQRLNIVRSSVTPDYFATMGITLLKGRNLANEDRTGDIRGVVVNRKFVETAWPNKDPIGQLIRGNNPGIPWFTARVVGVVENVKQRGANQDIQPEMYTTPEGAWGTRAILVVRSKLPLSQLAPALRRELASIDPELALNDLRTMQQVVDHSTQGDRTVTSLVNFFMAVALGLVAVGLYGTLSYHVQQRTREIGVRVAIGALKGDIVRLVFAQGSRWVGLGLGLGLAGSIGLSFALKSLVYHMDGLTAWPLLLAAVAVGLAATVACWLPAQRAAKLDPIEALRAD